MVLDHCWFLKRCSLTACTVALPAIAGYIDRPNIYIRIKIFVKCFVQEVTFASEDDLIPWIGLVHCEASYLNHQPVRSQGFHLVMWDTVTARLVSTCISCRLQNIQETAKIILAQVNIFT